MYKPATMYFHVSFMKLVPYAFIENPFSKAIIESKDFISEKHNCYNMWETFMMLHK